jgi:hypothetical protein
MPSVNRPESHYGKPLLVKVYKKEKEGVEIKSK